MQEAQAAAEAQAREAEGMEEDEEGLEEHDLDDDIPDGDQEVGEMGDETEWIDDGEEDGNNSMAEYEEEVDGLYPEEEMEDELATHGGEAVVVDLDDDIPEAGSYQHTDTEIEDESSINIYGGAMHSIPAGSSRGSWHPEPVSTSSAFGSSPVVHRNAERRHLERRNDGRAGRN